MLKPASALIVQAAYPVTADTPLGAVVALLGRLLADTRETLDRAYGVGQRCPAATDVPWTLQVQRDSAGHAREVISFAVRLDLADGGVAFRAEMDRRRRVAEMLARVAQAPMGPA